jgi:hypothetical protein
MSNLYRQVLILHFPFACERGVERRKYEKEIRQRKVRRKTKN